MRYAVGAGYRLEIVRAPNQNSPAPFQAKRLERLMAVSVVHVLDDIPESDMNMLYRQTAAAMFHWNSVYTIITA